MKCGVIYQSDTVVSKIEAAGSKAVALELNVGNSETFPAFRDAVVDVLARIWNAKTFDFPVNNAGYGLYNPITTVTEEQFEGLFRVHLKGPFFLTQTLFPLMADGGHIVNVTSATSRVATAGIAPYASFKGGLEVLTRYMAKEFGERRIHANSIAPGPIRTELGGGLSGEFEALLAGQTALGRVGEIDNVSCMVAGLLSDDNRWVNAQNIEITGEYIF